MAVLYAPGDMPVVVTAQGVAVLGAGVEADLAVAVWRKVADGRGLGGVLEALTGAFGASLDAIPPFVVALAEGAGVRVIVRGDLEATVHAAGGSQTVSGAGVTTWNERAVPDVSRIEIGASDAAASLPVSDGVVLAAALAWVRSDLAAGADDGADVVAPASAPTQVPAPTDASTPVPASAPAAEPISEPKAAPQPEPAPEPEPRSAPTSEPEPEPEPESAPSPEPGPAPEPDPAPAPAASPVPVPPPFPAPVVITPPAAPARPAVPARPTAPTALIDSAAVKSMADTLLPVDSTVSPQAAADGEVDETVVGVRASARAAEREAPAETVVRGDVSTAQTGPDVGDHDGATISVAEARRLRETGGALDDPGPLAPPRLPAPGRLRLSTGQVLRLDRTVVIGRRPRATRVSGTDLPHLVAVDSPQQDISRSHLELRVEGDSIVATDLRTTNGTTLLRTGADPVRLHPGEASVVVPGDVLDLGDGITVTIEDLA
ncbi:FHA domain-containing protein [Microbacterium sp. Marseille-Q6648]|uniref:FHA domain-containing protein n=1 Tax=Microbacterium sp. Marseille-Q6648 TaxID=2937991 RepID=UPI00203B4266|nr:FHA domain-containing protein [Microbacterium sp. Marseille-Q6648]